MVLTVTAPAKLNMTLDVLGQCENGYHEIATVMQAVTLSDTVTLIGTRKGHITLASHRMALPLDEKNTAWKAAQAFFEYVGVPETGVHITLDKRVPSQAGMGGGSADAAAVLVGLNEMFGVGLSATTLRKIAAKVGADVPFCVSGGAALAEGIGDRLTPLPSLPDCAVVVAKPSVGISTAAAYAAIDSAENLSHPDVAGMCDAMRAGDLSRVGALLGNAFYEANPLPQVTAILQKMREFSPLGSCMTGSGSAVFALFADTDAAKNCEAALRGICRSVWTCRPCRSGARVISRKK